MAGLMLAVGRFTKCPGITVCPLWGGFTALKPKLTASGGARTHNLRLRRPTLYPVELRTRVARIVILILAFVNQCKEELAKLVSLVLKVSQF
jgi:hypothetical protein